MKIGEVPQGVDSTRTKLSICVVTWNSESVIRSCLQAIYNDEMSGDWELFVVDNGSTDSTVGIVREEFPRAILLEPGENLGFSRANNLALTRAAGEFLLLLNPDTEPRPGALGKLVDFMQQESEVGIVGPRLIRPSGKLELSCGRSPTMIREIGRKLLLHRVFPFFRFGRWDHETRRSVGWVTGACLMVRRETGTQTGFLDPRIYMCLEDVDWCMRVRKAGWDVVYFPASEVIHIGGSIIRTNFTEMLVVSQQSLFYLFFKHFGKIHVQLLRFFTAIEMGLRMGLWSVMMASPAHHREARQRLLAYLLILRKTIAERPYYYPVTEEGRPSTSDE